MSAKPHFRTQCRQENFLINDVDHNRMVHSINVHLNAFSRLFKCVNVM